MKAEWISGHSIVTGWPVTGGAQRVVSADEAEAEFTQLQIKYALLVDDYLQLQRDLKAAQAEIVRLRNMLRKNAPQAEIARLRSMLRRDAPGGS